MEEFVTAPLISPAMTILRVLSTAGRLERFLQPLIAGKESIKT